MAIKLETSIPYYYWIMTKTKNVNNRKVITTASITKSNSGKYFVKWGNNQMSKPFTTRKKAVAYAKTKV